VHSHPMIGLIRNRRSHRNGGDSGLSDASLASAPNIIMRSPDKRSELAGVLEHFASQRVDYIAIDGGDGTVRDVLTCGAGVFGENWPALIVLPNGKTNALAHDLGIPKGWTLEQAMAALRDGRTTSRRPLVVTQRDKEDARIAGFVLGGGAFTAAIGLGQNAHRLGAFNAAVVGLTTVWSALQALLGRSDNPWRRGTAMRVRDAQGHDLPHLGGTPLDERYLLFASTLRTFPAGLRPFGNQEGDLRLAVMDNASRALLLRLPLMFMSGTGQTLRRLGFQVVGAERIDLDIGARFILDGEAFPAGSYRLEPGSNLRFVVP